MAAEDGFKFRALFALGRERPGDLELAPGDLLTVGPGLCQAEGYQEGAEGTPASLGWLSGVKDRTGERGDFPGTYVEYVGRVKTDTPSPMPRPQRPLPPTPPTHTQLGKTKTGERFIYLFMHTHTHKQTHTHNLVFSGLCSARLPYVVPIFPVEVCPVLCSVGWCSVGWCSGTGASLCERMVCVKVDYIHRCSH